MKASFRGEELRINTGRLREDPFHSWICALLGHCARTFGAQFLTVPSLFNFVSVEEHLMSKSGVFYVMFWTMRLWLKKRKELEANWSHCLSLSRIIHFWPGRKTISSFVLQRRWGRLSPFQQCHDCTIIFIALLLSNEPGRMNTPSPTLNARSRAISLFRVSMPKTLDYNFLKTGH